MLTAFIRRGDQTISTDPSAANLTAALRDPKSVLWLDMLAPTDDELALLDDVFAFHPLAIEDSIQASQRPKIESYRHPEGNAIDAGYFYMVIHEAAYDDKAEKLSTKEMDLFVSQRYLLTIHDEPMACLSHMLERTKADPNNIFDQGIDMLLHAVLDHLVDKYQPILDCLQEVLDALEEKAVTDPTPDLLPRIALKKRELLNLRRIIGPQRDVVAQLTRGDVPFIRESTRVYFRDVLDHLIRSVETIELYRDLVLGARDIYMSSINNNINQVMKTLTVISVIALPMTVVTSFFGMNFESIGALHSPTTFWVAMGLTIALVIGLLMFFRWKRWV